MVRSGIVIGALMALGACGDPLGGLDRISDVDLASDDPAAQALPSEAEVAREGFFGTTAAVGGAGAVVSAGDATGDTQAAAPRRRGGLFGLFRGDDASAAPQTDDAQANAQVAALTPETDTVAQPNRGGRGLFGLGGGTAGDTPRDGPDAHDVSFGTVLPHGVVARVCEAKGKSMGQKIDNGPARGYALYDSAAGAATARTFYITGFSDGCPRQFTAANVLLGAPSLYEQLHYGPGGEHLPVAETDRAYEAVKRQVCGARMGKPCGAKIGRMDRNTFFVSAYDSFGNSSRWTELLIHDGEVMAAAIKTSG